MFGVSSFLGLGFGSGGWLLWLRVPAQGLPIGLL